jgi:hypothetical protein
MPPGVCSNVRLQFHPCCGNRREPHITDGSMRDLVDVMLAINCHVSSFEVGNVRHEHEWMVWQDVGPPEGELPEDRVPQPTTPGALESSIDCCPPRCLAHRTCFTQ